jgi:hypothetical protein
LALEVWQLSQDADWCLPESGQAVCWKFVPLGVKAWHDWQLLPEKWPDLSPWQLRQLCWFTPAHPVAAVPWHDWQVVLV